MSLASPSNGISFDHSVSRIFQPRTEILVDVPKIAPRSETCPAFPCLGGLCRRGNAIHLKRDSKILFGYRHADDTCQVLFCNFFLYARNETKDTVCEFVRKKLGLQKLLYESAGPDRQTTLLSVDMNDRERVYDLANLLIQGEHAIAMNDNVTSYVFANHTNDISYETHKRVIAMNEWDRAWPPRRIKTPITLAPISSNQRRELHDGFAEWKMVPFQNNSDDDVKTKDGESKWLQQVLGEIETLEKRQVVRQESNEIKEIKTNKTEQNKAIPIPLPTPSVLPLVRTADIDFKSPATWLNETLMSSLKRPNYIRDGGYVGFPTVPLPRGLDDAKTGSDAVDLATVIEPLSSLPQFVSGDGKPCVAVIADGGTIRINKGLKRRVVPHSMRTPESIRKEWEQQDALDNLEYLAEQNSYIIDGPPVFASDFSNMPH